MLILTEESPYNQLESQPVSITSRNTVISITKVILERDELFCRVTITYPWTKSLLKCMGYVRRTKASLNALISEGVQKEIVY